MQKKKNMETTKKSYFIVREANKHHRFLCENISHITIQSYLCTIHRIVGDNAICTKSLSYFENLLLPSYFFRISRNAIVNIKQIEYVECKKRKRIVVLKKGDKLPVSNLRWKDFKTLYYGQHT